MIDVSIVAPVYNVEKYIRPSIESMLAQTHKNIEIILVDDGSKDNSGKICDEYAAKDARVRVIHKENGGTASARNAGMDAAVGKYVYFGDPDDLMEPNLIEDNFPLMEKHNAQICVFGYELFVEKGGKLVSEGVFSPGYDGLMDYREFWDNFLKVEKRVDPTLWCRMFLREYLVESKLRANTRFIVSQDVLFTYDAYEHGFDRIIYNSKTYYKYLRRGGGAVLSYKPTRIELSYEVAQKLLRIVNTKDPVAGRYENWAYEGLARHMAISFRMMEVLPPREMHAIIKSYMDKEDIKASFRRLNLKNAGETKRLVRWFLLKRRWLWIYVLMARGYKFAQKLGE